MYCLKSVGKCVMDPVLSHNIANVEYVSLSIKSVELNEKWNAKLIAMQCNRKDIRY